MSLAALWSVGCVNRDEKSKPAPLPAPSSTFTYTVPPVVNAADDAAACDTVTCATFKGSPQFFAGRATALPADFPSPPKAATVCGDSLAFHTNYYATTDLPADTLAYYERQLDAAGFHVRPHASGMKKCSLQFIFYKSDSEVGTMTAYVGGYSINYSGK